MTLPARWIDKDGKAVSCKDKLSTLDDNLAEVLEIALDALEDAAVMGVDTAAARAVFVEEIAALQPRFVAQSGGQADSTAATSDRDASGSVTPVSTDRAES